jgi:hypothetical protein
MRPTDRDFIVSTLSVIQEQRRQVISVLDDMNMRIDELEDQLIFSMDQQENDNYDTLIENAWLSGLNYVEFELKNDSSGKKECMCDSCWDVPSDKYEHRMD